MVYGIRSSKFPKPQKYPQQGFVSDQMGKDIGRKVPPKPRGFMGGPPQRRQRFMDTLSVLGATLKDLDGTMGTGNAALAMDRVQYNRSMREQEAQERERMARQQEFMSRLTPEQQIAYQANPDAFGKAYAEKMFAGEPERRTIKGVDGKNYFVDTGEPVLPGVEVPEKQMSPYEQARIDLQRDRLEFDKDRPRTPLVSVTNTPTHKGETAFQQGRGSAASNSMDAIRDAGSAANAALADAKMMDALIDQIDYVGFGSETLMNVQKVGRMIGLDIGDDVPAKEAATRLTAKLGLSLKSDLPGPMSDGDRQFLLSIPPNIATTRAGNKALVYMTMKRAEFDQAMHEALVQANPQTMQEYYAWENEYRRSQPPIFSDADRADLIAALGGQ